MARSKIYLRTHDIDWAVKIGEIYIHVSSAGDDLPKIVDKNLWTVWKELKRSKNVCDEGNVKYNDDYLNELFPLRPEDEELRRELLQQSEKENEMLRREWYIHSFRAMAMRGFYSFDRDLNSPIGDSYYRLVAYPSEKVTIGYDLPVIDDDISKNLFDKLKLVERINSMTNTD